MEIFLNPATIAAKIIVGVLVGTFVLAIAASIIGEINTYDRISRIHRGEDPDKK